MTIDTLHVTNIYSGLLSCSNVAKYNEKYLASLREHIHTTIPDHAPLHTIIPASAPSTLPPYLCIVLLHGEPKNRSIAQFQDENGDEYHGFWLAVALFIKNTDVQSIESGITQAKLCFDEHAQGYFF